MKETPCQMGPYSHCVLFPQIQTCIFTQKSPAFQKPPPSEHVKTKTIKKVMEYTYSQHRIIKYKGSYYI